MENNIRLSVLDRVLPREIDAIRTVQKYVGNLGRRRCRCIYGELSVYFGRFKVHGGAGCFKILIIFRRSIHRAMNLNKCTLLCDPTLNFFNFLNDIFLRKPILNNFNNTLLTQWSFDNP